MKIKKQCLLIILFLTVWIYGSFAQAASVCVNTLRTARTTYDEGKTLEGIDILESCIEDGFTKDEKTEAYRLLMHYYKAEADKLRYLGVASTMAIKSKQLGGDQKQLKGLLAQQAYLFNTQHGGKEFEYDNDIYNGLYSALEAFTDPLVRDIEGHSKSVRAVESTVEGNHIYTGGTVGKILRWNVQGNERYADTLVHSRENHVIRSMVINTAVNIILVGGEYPYLDSKKSTYIDLVNMNQTGSVPAKLKGFEIEVWKILLHPDKKGAYVLDKLGHSIKYTDFDKVYELVSNTTTVNDIAITADGNWLLAGTDRGKVVKYDLNNNMASEEIFDNGSKIRAIAISNDNYFTIGDEDGNLKVVNLTNVADVNNQVGHISWINNIRFSSDNRFIATSSNDKTVRLWDRQNLTVQPITLSDHDGWVQSVAFSPDNSKVLAGTQFKHIKVYPTHRIDMADILCSEYLTRNLTIKEWETYVGDVKDLPFVTTCPN